jgi:hypothetical protein
VACMGSMQSESTSGTNIKTVTIFAHGALCVVRWRCTEATCYAQTRVQLVLSVLQQQRARQTADCMDYFSSNSSITWMPLRCNSCP